MEQLKEKILARLNIANQEGIDDSTDLNEILGMSPTAINSIDIMEAFAGAITDLGYEDELDLPAFTLDATLSDVLKEISSQLEESEITP